MSDIKRLLLLFAIDTELPIIERIDLYAKLLHEPVVYEDIIHSIKDLANSLVRCKNFEMIDYMNYILDTNVKIPHEDTIYRDAHNVHELVHDTISTSKIIMDDYPADYVRPFEHPFFDTIELAGTFNDEFDITRLFASVYKFIKTSDHEEELTSRLMNELDDSIGSCVSGHVCRLINSIRGFSSRYDVSLDEFQYWKAKIFSNLSSLIDLSDPKTICDQIKTLINDRKLEYDTSFIIKILNLYTGSSWHIVNDLFDYID